MKLFKKKNLYTILTDVAVWTGAMLFYVLLRFVGLDNAPFITIADSFNFKDLIQITLRAGMALGLIFGVIDVLLDQQWLRRRPFGMILLIKGGIHLIVFLAISVAVRVEAFNMLGIEVTIDNLREALLNPELLLILLYSIIVSFLLNFMRQIDQKFGPGNLRKFITGKFHQPIQEHRIFMFLDLRSSTTIAERLGHIKFSQLIQDCFQDLSVVATSGAEVYQYVGDEAVLSWESPNGLDDCNCLKAFYDFKEALKARGTYYENRYHVAPVFKAGLNIGAITVAEVGDLKRDIAFHGDTINTAARIQDQCNHYQQELIISESLHKQLPKMNTFKRSLIGNVDLKGKQEPLALYAVEKSYSAFTKK